MAGGKKNQGNQGGNQGGKAPAAKKEDFKFDFQGQNAATLSKETQAELLPVLQKKLGQLVGKSSGYLETLPKSVQLRVGALKHLQAKTDEFDAAYRKEVAELDEKYRKLKDPLFTRRSEIVSGSAEPTPAEIVDAKPSENASAEEVKGIPNFWLEALKHHPQFGMMITDDDEKVLEHLKDIKVATVSEEPGPSFALEFHFGTNEYFNEEVIKKTYHLKEDKDLNEVIFERVEASDLTWKEGKNVTVKLVTKQQKVGGKRGGKNRGGKGGKPQTKTITVEEAVPSFFNFFQPPSEDEFEDDEDGEEELQAILEDDYEMGIMIKSMIVPNAVNWYTGEVEIPEDVMFPYGDDEDDEDDEEGGEEEEYNSGEDEDFDPKKAPQGQNGQQPECKQQ